MNAPALLRRAGFALALLVFGQANAQLVMTVDWSNLSQVKFTATGNVSAINYSGALTFNDGVALLGFFTSPVNVRDFGTRVSSTLSDSANASYFLSFSSWDDANPGKYTGFNQAGSGSGSDVTLWTDTTAHSGSDTYAGALMNFSTGSSAFNGEAVWDFSGNAAFTNLFPALNATGNLGILTGGGTLGTWQVVGAASAIPEPSTCALLAGLGGFGAVLLRRRAQRIPPAC